MGSGEREEVEVVVLVWGWGGGKGGLSREGGASRNKNASAAEKRLRAERLIVLCGSLEAGHGTWDAMATQRVFSPHVSLALSWTLLCGMP